MRLILAEDVDTGELVGFAVWQISGRCALAKRWAREEPWWLPVERQLLDLEVKYFRYVTNRCIDYCFKDELIENMHKNFDDLSACLHLVVLTVPSKHERKGIGRAMVRWGLDLQDRRVYLWVWRALSPVRICMTQRISRFSSTTLSVRVHRVD